MIIQVDYRIQTNHSPYETWLDIPVEFTVHFNKYTWGIDTANYIAKGLLQDPSVKYVIWHVVGSHINEARILENV